MQESDPEALKKELMEAQEISFAKVLAGNDKKMRDRAIKKLIKWLVIRSKCKTVFTEENFKRIWAGLFYCMWMSDKLLVQEELAESISKLIRCFNSNNESALLFIKGFYSLMNTEWPGIDQHRIDKFCMLIRRFLRRSLEFCKRKDWNESLVKGLAKIFEETVLDSNAPFGFTLHFIEIFPEELAKVSGGKLKNETTMIFFEIFIKLAGLSYDSRLHEVITEFFNHLIRQTDLGIEYEEKFQAWKEQGMPCEKPEDLELCEEESESEDEGSEIDELLEDGPLDPRAGKVDVVLPQIPVDFDGIISLIQRIIVLPSTSSRGRRTLKTLESKFQNLKKGIMPETIKKPQILDQPKKRRKTYNSVKELIRFTEELKNDENGPDLVCDEVDSDNDSDCNGVLDDNNSDDSIRRKKTKKNGRSSDIENSQDNRVKKTKLKSGKKKKAQEEVKKTKKIKVKPNEGKNTPLKPKSPRDTFSVEDVGAESNVLTITPRKRKALSAWQIHDLEADSEEYKKITVPKIIKLETKGSSPLVEKKEVEQSSNETPVKKPSPVKLTPSFWNKAKEKAFKKKNSGNGSMLLNPFSPAESKNSKRISFALDRNEAQEIDEYLEEVKNSPRIPFDCSKNPVQSALKSGLSPSPINPFYRFKKIK
ncbi:UNVERIFIED_CONTAM: hypothetical protein PYX00_006113 [Menopon gallinae]|uniref:Ribosomal RNA processing protein 1 homolog n=1 Tax=Menopon gallinae TaxID=328185 RepID=A0AAW2HVE1_9NEOP